MHELLSFILINQSIDCCKENRTICSSDYSRHVLPQIQLQVLRPFLAEAFPEECLKQWWTTDGFMSIFAVFARNAQGVGVS